MYYTVDIEGHATRTRSITEDNYISELESAQERLNKWYKIRTGKDYQGDYTVTNYFEDFDFE